ncbi:MAG: DUF1015 domain-containing protein [Oligosphaeraceae bacterium]|nr:DUF1015 domain-containing protein [Oligosphaeraceae bacterium]
MAQVFPFPAWLAPADQAARIATLPYDVMNRQEAAKMAADNPLSFLRVTRSEIELPDSVCAYDASVYERAAANWQKFRREYLRQDAKPGFYVYSLIMQGRRQTGVVAAASVHDYNNDVIRKHERTRQDKEDDRTRHISTIRAQTGAVFLTYRDSAEIDRIVNLSMQTEPLFDFRAEDGIGHTGWRVPEQHSQALQEAFAQVPLLYIADGHHRAASASRTCKKLLEQGEKGEIERFLSVIFPAGQLHIMPYNRVVLDLNGLSEEQFLTKLAQVCRISDTDKTQPDEPGQVCLYFQKRWRLLDFKQKEAASPAEALDVSLLQNQVLSPILGIENPRTSQRIDFIGGIRGTDELIKLVDNGQACLAFSMYPTTVNELMQIADRGEIMPPKSTWFEPKLRDGLFTHEI